MLQILETQGRATQGVKLINLISMLLSCTVAKVIHEEEVEDLMKNELDSETESSDNQNNEAPSTEDTTELK